MSDPLRQKAFGFVVSCALCETQSRGENRSWWVRKKQRVTRAIAPHGFRHIRRMPWNHPLPWWKWRVKVAGGRYFETCMLTSGMQEAQDWENWEVWESSELWDRELSSDTGPFLSAKNPSIYFTVMQTSQIPYKRWMVVNNTPTIWNIIRPMIPVPFWNVLLFTDV